ncbi:MAG: glycosyltransferase family 2 protein [Rikenellaceae bacterium]|nr:glycosyltransferase family 2 protein [Rikenellaceae bacterium]
MKNLHIITPVKDSIASTLQTIKAIMSSEIDVKFSYTIYNDFSSEHSTQQLKKYSEEYGFELVNLSDITDHPSPNYLLVLQMAQQRAIAQNADLLIIESDVIVAPDTIQRLVSGAVEHKDCGIAASVTVDDNGDINYPYGYAKGHEGEVYAVDKHCSFCCSLLTNRLLRSYDFNLLNPDKHWFDVHISHISLDMGLKNYLFCNLPVIHRPHSSRPWKQLKYTNPLKYYWRKFVKRFDKI